MKKSLIAFLCTFIALPAVADNYIKFKASAIEDTINTMVPETHRGATADEYQKQMDSTTGKISVLGIYKVCAAAGFDINNTNGYNGCRLFINTIAEKSGFGSGNATQQNCRTKFNGIWTVTADGTEQCVGKDGHKLVYSASCHGGDGKCIRDFASLQTQVPPAKEFIYAYGKKHEIAFTCSNEKVDIKKIGDDYIKCSAGGVAYEFQFDDLNQDPGQTAVESENTALCEMFGGKIVKHPDSSIEKQWQSCEVSREICNGPLHNLAIKIGHNVMYQGYCRLSRQYKFKSQEELQTLPGVDSYVFYDTGAQMRADMAVAQTEEYLRTKFPHETYINCNPGISLLRDYSERPVIDTKEYDYIMHCTVGSKQVDFVFDDLTETMDYAATSGEAKMACAILGARVDGKNCRDLTDSDCTELGKKLQERGMKGTDYVPEKGGCILLDAQTEDHINLGIEVAGGLVATYLTGGVGLAVSIVSIGTDLGFDAINQYLRNIPYGDYAEFMEHANKCSDTDTSIENQYCVGNVLTKYFALIAGNMDNLASEVQSAASAKLLSMMNILSDRDVLTTVDLSHISVQKQSRKLASIGALGLLMLANPDKWATKADNMIKQSLKLKASADWVENLNDFLKMGARFSIPRGKLSDGQWMELNGQLSKQGLRFVDDGYGYMKMTHVDKGTYTVFDAFIDTMPHKKSWADLNSAKEKLVHLGHGVTDFDGLINDFVHNNGPFPGHFTRKILTDSEFDELAKWFKSEHNLTLGVDDHGILKIERPTVATVDPVAAMQAKLRSGTKTSPLDLAKPTQTSNGYKVMDDGTIVRETPEAVATATKADDVAQVAKRTPLMDEYKLSQSDMDIVRSCDITFGDARYTLEQVLENPRILDDLDDDITLIKEAQYTKDFINGSDMGDDAYYEILDVLKRIEDIPVSGMRTKLQRIGYNVDDIANGNLDKTLTKWGLSPYDRTYEINQQLNSVENMMEDLDTAFSPYSGVYYISDEVSDWVFAYSKEKEQVERYTDMLRQFNKIGYQPDFAHIPNNAVETLTARWDLPRYPTENDITWRMQDIENTFRSYGDVVESSDAVYELQRQFRLEKEAAEKYIRHITGTY